jgi:hypothetical protein
LLRMQKPKMQAKINDRDYVQPSNYSEDYGNSGHLSHSCILFNEVHSFNQVTVATLAVPQVDVGILGDECLVNLPRVELRPKAVLRMAYRPSRRQSQQGYDNEVRQLLRR